MCIVRASVLFSEGLVVDFRWSVGLLLRVGLSDEQGGAGVGGLRPLPSGVASGPLNT